MNDNEISIRAAVLDEAKAIVTHWCEVPELEDET